MNGFFLDTKKMESFIYTVTQLNNHSKSILENNLNNIWVSGEIINFKVYGSGHAYFTLKDANSEISCTWFNYNSINKIKDSDLVTLNGNVTIYNTKGRFQLVVKDSFIKGKGKESIELLKLKKKLYKEGLFDQKNKNKIPKYPKNIAILTSINGAVIKDMINIYSRRAPYLKLFLYDVKVQGTNSSNMITDFIELINIKKNIDLIIIARGGGSSSDLTSFNDESLVRSISKSSIPIITAIGHEIDTSLSDLASDLKCSTPSEAAELSVPDITDLLQYIDSQYGTLESCLKNRVKNYLLSLQANNFLSSIEKKNLYIKSFISIMDNNYAMFEKTVNFNLEKYKNSINIYNNILKQNNIESLKKIGFSIIKKNGKILNNSEDIYVNDVLNVDMYNGSIEVYIGDIKRNEKK